MKIKWMVMFLMVLLLLTAGMRPALALVHTQKEGLFSMDIPAEWHWMEYPQAVIITYPDGKNMAIDIEMVPSDVMSQADIKKTLQQSADKVIKQGIEAHHGTLIANKEISLDGAYATRLDFKTDSADNPIYVTDISCFYKGYAMTITYGSEDQKMHAMMDDVTSTFKFKKS